jgi:hypothetical protein
VDLELTTLASAAATTLVGLMMTDSWGRFKSVVAALWHRASPEEVAVVDAELAQAHPAVLSARASGDDQSEADITRHWTRRLLQLMADDPAAASELRRLVAQWQLISPEGQPKGKRAPGASVQMTAKARGHGRVYQAAGDIRVVDSDPGA